MNQPHLGRTRLYNQIVYPLLVAAIVVGVVATLIAVYFLQDLTNTWVQQTATSSTKSVSRRFEIYVAQMQQVAHIAASVGAVSEAASENDPAKLNLDLIKGRDTLKMDAVYVVDSAGVVVAISGVRDVEIGAALLGREKLVIDRASVRMNQMMGSTRLMVLEPIVSSRGRYAIVLTRVVDDDFVKDLGLIEQSAFCVYSARGERVAYASGEGLPSRVSLGLHSVTRRNSPEIAAAIRLRGSAPDAMKVGSSNFAVHAEPVMLPKDVYAGTLAYVVGIVSQRVSEDAGRTTTQLIFMWSVVAVITLGALGGWVARRVSDPLVQLAAGARLIADGNFDTKVRITGANEVAELADTFNDMTESLRERSETLTKKVLELSTLYEMSRSLGSTLDLDELLGSTLDSALRIFSVDSGYIALRDKDDGEIRVRALRVDAESARLGEKSTMSEWVIREGRPLIFNPDLKAGSTRIDSVTGAKAALCVPLVSAEGNIGSVTIGSSDPGYRFSADDVRLLSTIANHVTIAIGNIELFSSLQEAYLATVRSLAAAVDAKDSYTRGHSERVATYSTLISERMDLSHEQRIALEMAAYLHDIGKIGVREEILLKPGPLDTDEQTLMRHHPLIGANILKPVAFPWAITPVVRHHHEAFDGTGYPAGLRGDEIPLLARVLSVADSFEAMTASRPYRAGMSTAEAVIELRQCSGTQFDPRVVDVFVEVLGEIEQEGDPTRPESPDEVLPDEARGVFAALVDGLFSSFRRLGGPRLSSNVESEVDAFLANESMPFRISRGRITYISDTAEDVDEELECMRITLRHIDKLMARVSGVTLVDHFYEDAFRAFSARMRHLANVLGFTYNA